MDSTDVYRETQVVARTVDEAVMHTFSILLSFAVMVILPCFAVRRMDGELDQEL